MVIAGILLASSAPGALGAIPRNETRFLAEIRAGKGTSFASLIRKWEARHGTDAVEPLLGIARTKSHADHERYVALMGVAKLGGRETGPVVAGFLKDPSWMMRAGALRALSALKNPKTSASVLPLLKDPALVVRTEAVQAIEELRPDGAANALLGALGDPANYRAGKAQWVPGRALSALVALKAKEAAPRLRPLLDRSADPELLQQTISALEALTGKTLKPQASLAEQVVAWKKAL